MLRPNSTLTELLSQESPLVLPTAHDALSARLIEQAGFKAALIGGFGAVGCRYGLPDLGLASLAEMSAAVRDIAAATTLPLIVDCDDGYGDVKNVVRTVRTYEAIGASALILEDQVSPKSCGHMSLSRQIVPIQIAEAKLAAALDARRSSGLAIIARTDARSVNGLDAALERGRRYVAKGIDALFIEAPTSIEELKLIGENFTLPLLANALEAGKTPMLSPAQYRELGFSMVVYTTSLLLRMISTLKRTLGALRQGQLLDVGPLPDFEELTRIMGMPDWIEIERRFDAREVPLSRESTWTRA